MFGCHNWEKKQICPSCSHSLLPNLIAIFLIRLSIVLIKTFLGYFPLKKSNKTILRLITQTSHIKNQPKGQKIGKK